MTCWPPTSSDANPSNTLDYRNQVQWCHIPAFLRHTCCPATPSELEVITVTWWHNQIISGALGKKPDALEETAGIAPSECTKTGGEEGMHWSGYVPLGARLAASVGYLFPSSTAASEDFVTQHSLHLPDPPLGGTPKKWHLCGKRSPA